MATAHTTTEVKLLGQRIVLKSSVSDPDMVQKIVDLVSNKLMDAELRNKGTAPHQVALLALLELAEEYLKAKDRTVTFKQQVQDKSNRLMSLLEAQI